MFKNTHRRILFVLFSVAACKDLGAGKPETGKPGAGKGKELSIEKISKEFDLLEQELMGCLHYKPDITNSAISKAIKSDYLWIFELVPDLFISPSVNLEEFAIQEQERLSEERKKKIELLKSSNDQAIFEKRMEKIRAKQESTRERIRKMKQRAIDLAALKDENSRLTQVCKWLNQFKEHVTQAMPEGLKKDKELSDLVVSYMIAPYAAGEPDDERKKCARCFAYFLELLYPRHKISFMLGTPPPLSSGKEAVKYVRKELPEHYDPKYPKAWENFSSHTAKLPRNTFLDFLSKLWKILEEEKDQDARKCMYCWENMKRPAYRIARYGEEPEQELEKIKSALKSGYCLDFFVKTRQDLGNGIPILKLINNMLHTKDFDDSQFESFLNLLLSDLTEEDEEKVFSYS